MKKEYTYKSKILSQIVIGIAVYGGSFLLSLLVISPFSEIFRYKTSTVSAICTFVAATAAFLCISGNDKITLLYDPTAVFSKKAYFPVLVILTSFALTVLLNFLYSKIPWDMFGDKYIVQNNDSLYSVPLYFRIISYVFIGPFAEEVLFRGIVFSRFKKIMPLWASVIASSLFFAVYHGNLMQGSYAFLMGSVMCLSLHFGGSFLYPLLFHMIANLISNLCHEYDNINNVVYSPISISLCAAYVVVAIILCYVFKVRLTKKDKEC